VGPTALPIWAGPGYNGQRVAAAEGKEGEGGFFFLYFLGMSNMNVLFYSVDIKMATLVQQVDLVAGKQSNNRFFLDTTDSRGRSVHTLQIVHSSLFPF
jgi:hypothetical protein